MMFAKVIDHLRKVNLPIAILRFMLGGVHATCCIVEKCIEVAFIECISQTQKWEAKEAKG